MDGWNAINISDGFYLKHGNLTYMLSNYNRFPLSSFSTTIPVPLQFLDAQFSGGDYSFKIVKCAPIRYELGTYGFRCTYFDSNGSPIDVYFQTDRNVTPKNNATIIPYSNPTPISTSFTLTNIKIYTLEDAPQ